MGEHYTSIPTALVMRVRDLLARLDLRERDRRKAVQLLGGKIEREDSRDEIRPTLIELADHIEHTPTIRITPGPRRAATEMNKPNDPRSR